MRHVHHFQGRQFREDSEIPKTHVVIGQRHDPLADTRPPADMAKLSAEEVAARQEYTFKLTHGWFAMKTLAWATSAEDAAALAARFPEPEWIHVRVLELTPADTIQYA